MDTSKLKGILGKLGFIKDFSSLLVPVVILIVACVVFVPAKLVSRSLKNRIEQESITSLGRRVASLSRDPIASEQWKVERMYQKFYEADANHISLLAKQSSQRELLSYKIFPEPSDTSSLIFEQFGNQYRSGLEQLIEKLNARDCPSEAELQRSLQSSGITTYTGSFGFPAGGFGEMGGFTGRSTTVGETIKEELCRAKAEAASVYANVSNISGYDFWRDYEYVGISESVEDCWYWQLAYWVVEDVVDTVEAYNAGSQSVFNSPVKRIMSVNFSRGQQTFRTNVNIDRPTYVTSEGQAMAFSFTGRACNEQIDVIHFTVTVVVDSKAVLPFMQKLCSSKEHTFRGWSGLQRPQGYRHNQITVLESSISSIERAEPVHNLYRYGDDAAVKLSLACEYVFSRSGYDAIKPESVRSRVGI